MGVSYWTFSLAFGVTALIFTMVEGWLPLVIAEDYHVAILTSQSTGPYGEVLTGFRNYFTQHRSEAVFDEYVLQEEADQAPPILQKIKRNDISMLLTVGSTATQAAIKERWDLPIVACLIVTANVLQHAPNATGVVLEFPLEIQFQWMRNILPQNRTIGVLFNPQENQHKIEEATRIAQSMGLCR